MRQVKKEIQDKSGLEVARIIAKAARDKKAVDVVVLDVQGLASFTDYFVIMSGNSTRHVQGLAEAINKVLAKKRIKDSTSEGIQEGLWVLLDYDDVVVHIFYSETRTYYDLESLWHDAPRIEI